MRASNSSMAELLEGSKVFAVPLFQRQYSWERDQWRALWRNIKEQYEFEGDELQSGAAPVNHFIGSFVLSPISTGGPPPRILVVDGQQRLITISVLLAALRDVRWEATRDPSVRRWLEDDFTKSYLVNSVLMPTPEKKFRVLPTQRDRDDFAATVENTPGTPSGRVGEAYRYFHAELRGKDSDGNAFDLERLTNVLLSRLTLIDVRTERGDNVHRVFQTLNSSGVRLKQIDLLRNHFFMLLPTRGEEIYLEVWRDMELRLGETAMDSFFWSSLVPYDRRVSRRTVFNVMQDRLDRDGLGNDEERVEALLRQLNRDSVQYLALNYPTEEPRPAIRERLLSLKAWGTDTYYPLGLALLKAERDQKITEIDLVASLLSVESFLVRRMLVGIPTNNLNRIFSTMTGSVPEANILKWLRQALATVGRPWPDDATVSASVVSRPFLFSGQPSQRVFVVRRIEEKLRASAELGDLSGEQLMELRRTMPPDLSKAWPATTAEEIDLATGIRRTADEVRSAREKSAHTLGNVSLLLKGSPEVADEFTIRREQLLNQGFLFNEDIIRRSEWDPTTIEDRAIALARLVVAVWPGPSKSTDSFDSRASRSDRVILLLPEDGYCLVSDLAELWATSESEVAAQISEWPADARGRVRTSEAEPGTSAANLPTRRFTAADLARLVEVEDSDDLEQSDR